MLPPRHIRSALLASLVMAFSLGACAGAGTVAPASSALGALPPAAIPPAAASDETSPDASPAAGQATLASPPVTPSATPSASRRRTGSGAPGYPGAVRVCVHGSARSPSSPSH